jgi:hypothetical protein
MVGQIQKAKEQCDAALAATEPTQRSRGSRET